MSLLHKIIPAKFHYRIAETKHFFTGYKKYAQFGEDTALLEIFKDQEKGFYIDVGAHHPERYSNTYLLFKKGWNGINIDPNPHTIKLFNRARPNDTQLNIGIGTSTTPLDYYTFSDPAVNSFSNAHAEQWMNKSWITFLGVERISVHPLSEVMKEHVHDEIDLLTIDAEGMDLDVLESNDWADYRPKVIVVEGDVRDFLESKGYRFYKECGLSSIFLRV